MSDHWRVALKYAAWFLAAAVVISGVLLLLYGAGTAWSFFYGAGVALLSFVSTALTISLFAGRSMAAGLLIGVGSFLVKLAFAAVVLGIPAYLELWPVVPMLVAFAGVYAVENVAAMFRVARTGREPGAKPGTRGSAGEREVRKVGS
jgi:hypothetical protein